mgnify:FL=1
MHKNDIIDNAKTIINGERQGTYGNAEDNFAGIAAFWSTYLNTPIDSTDVANMMILMKVARNSSGVYKDDNYIDICGYAALGGEIASRPSKNEVTYASIMNAIKQVGEEIDEYIASVKEDDTNEE